MTALLRALFCCEREIAQTQQSILRKTILLALLSSKMGKGVRLSIIFLCQTALMTVAAGGFDRHEDHKKNFSN